MELLFFCILIDLSVIRLYQFAAMLMDANVNVVHAFCVDYHSLKTASYASYIAFFAYRNKFSLLKLTFVSVSGTKLEICDTNCMCFQWRRRAAAH